MNYLGLNDASISQMNGGKNVILKRNYSRHPSGDIWLNKVKYDRNGNRMRGNVCLEVYLPSRGTCLLQHVNLGACEFDDIPKAFVEGMSELCALHATTGVGKSGEYLPPETDRQVGLGMLGLANLLRRVGVTYEQFGRALDQYNDGQIVQTPAYELVTQFGTGIHAAASIARGYNMERAFAIAPTASCSYRSKDVDGYTCTPEIAPPISRHRRPGQAPLVSNLFLWRCRNCI